MIAGGSKCCFAGGYNGECGGAIRWHHPVTQSRLKREFKYGAIWLIKAGHWVPCSRYDPVIFSTPGMTCALKDIISDQRNRVWICDTHHERLHNGRFYIDELPESVWIFAREFGLDAALENDLARRAVSPCSETNERKVDG